MGDPNDRSRVAPALCIVALFLVGPGTARADRVHLVAAGFNTGLPDEAPLFHAERDAVEIADVMRRFGGAAPENVALVTGGGAEALRRTLIATNSRIRGEQGEDGATLIVYYSGHADASALHANGEAVSLDEIVGLVRGSPAKVRILVFDACRSGGGTRAKGASPAPEFDVRVDDRLGAEGFVVITSSAADEESHESDRLRSSLFTHHFVTALRGAGDSDRDGSVTLTEAYDYAYRQTLRSSVKAPRMQHPTYEYDIKGRGGLVLTRLRNDRGGSATLVFREPGLYLVLKENEEGPIVAEVAVPEKGARLMLAGGRYFVQHRASAEYREFRVRLDPGKEMELDAVPFKTVAYSRLVRKGGGEGRMVHGVAVLGGSRGEILAGFGPAPHAALRYSIDLPWLTAGARARFTTTQARSKDGLTVMTNSEYALGLLAQRFLDLPWFSLALGLITEAALMTQRFTTDGTAPAADSLGWGFGGLFTVQREIFRGLAIEAEAGPFAYMLNGRRVEAGRPAGEHTLTPVTWWAAGGVVWRF